MVMDLKELQLSFNGRCACAGRRLRYPLERDLAFRLECVGSMTNPLADEHEDECHLTDGKRQRLLKASCCGIDTLVLPIGISTRHSDCLLRKTTSGS